MAQQFITVPAPPSANDNQEALFLNLVENIAFRRAKQDQKNARKQVLEAQMASGLMPQAEITITDEGLQFEGESSPYDQSLARKSFYKALGVFDPADDKTQEGFTNVKETFVPNQDERFAEQVAQAQRAANETMSEEERELTLGNYRAASSMLGTVAADGIGDVVRKRAQDIGTRPPAGSSFTQPQPTTPPAATVVPEATSSATPPAATPTTPSAQNIGATATAPGVKSIEEPPTPQSLGSMMAKKVGKAKYVEPPVTPTTDDKQKPVMREKKSESFSDTVKEMGQVEVAFKRGGFDTQMANVSQRTTYTQPAQIDEIKRSIPKLAALASLENYANQMLMTRGYNAGAPLENTYGSMLNQRVKDLQRWEEAQTKGGISQTFEKQTPFETKVRDSSADLKVTRRNELGAKNVFNIDSAPKGDRGAGVVESALPASAAGQTTKVSYDKTSRMLTGDVSGLAFKSTGALQFDSGEGLVGVLKRQADLYSTGTKQYTVKIEKGTPKDPKKITVTTPSGPITLVFNAGLQRSEFKTAEGKAMYTHGWTVSADAGLQIAELERFAGHQLGKEE